MLLSKWYGVGNLSCQRRNRRRITCIWRSWRCRCTKTWFIPLIPLSDEGKSWKWACLKCLARFRKSPPGERLMKTEIDTEQIPSRMYRKCQQRMIIQWKRVRRWKGDRLWITVLICVWYSLKLVTGLNLWTGMTSRINLKGSKSREAAKAHKVVWKIWIRDRLIGVTIIQTKINLK